MMIHDPSTITLGTAADHAKAADTLNVLAETYAGVYARRAGIMPGEMRLLMKEELWMGPSEAIDRGFADAITGIEADDDAPLEMALTAGAIAAASARHGATLQMIKKAAGMTSAAAKVALGGTTPATVATKKEVASMTTKGKKPEPTPGAPTPEPSSPDTTMAATAAAAAEAERKRIKGIAKMAAPFLKDGRLEQTEVDALIDDGTGIDAAGTRMLASVATREPAAPRSSSATVQRDARDKFREGAERALMAKEGMTGGERNEFSSLTLSELARETLVVAGEDRRFTSREAMISRAFTMTTGGMSTSDFGSILANVMGKAALMGWEEAEETFHLWTRRGTLADFKTSKRVGLGLVGALREVPAGAEYKYVSVDDRGEDIALATYGEIININRQAIINDDLSMLGELPRKMGRAARRTVGNLAYAVLTGNPTMADGVALFHASHANLAASGAAPSVATLDVGRTAMRTQKEKTGGSSLNITPRFLLVPSALEVTSRQLLESSFDPTSNKGHAKNPVSGMADLIVEARLDDDSATAWYLGASPGAFDTVEVAYLDGMDAPFLEQKDGWTVDGSQMKVRIDAGVAPLDHRTLYKNPGV